METRRPLDGIRVLELAQVVVGPFCGTLMAEFGAEVIKTEMPGKGDDLRRLGPSEDGVSYWFAVDNRNKKLMTLDLRTPKGQEIVRRLVPTVDVVLENFRPGVLEKWGLGWETLRALNPRLVMARITAFGQTGPLRQGPGYAAIGSAFGGTWYVSGHADRPPARPTPVYPDYLTGLFTAFGVMAALRHRDAAGEGQWIDAALYESAFRIMEFTTTFYGRQGVVRERGGLQHAGWPGGAFETLDHRWIVFTAPAQHLFERLCVMLGQPDLPNDPRFAGATERPKHIDVILEMPGAGSDGWAAFYADEDNPLVLLEDAHLAPLLGDVRGLDVVDLGCGTGRRTLRLAAAGARVTAVDFSEGMVAKARAKPGWGRVRFVAHDLTRPLPFADRAFDRVLSFLVLDHLADVATFFAECRRVCRGDGFVLVSSFHPAMMLRGIQARFTDPVTGREVRPASIANQLSDYVMGAVRSGLALEHMSEHAVDDALAARSPKAAKYLGWPLLLLMRLRP